jgi:hypothetical protein
MLGQTALSQVDGVVPDLFVVPADDRPGGAVDHERDVDEPRPGPAVGEVGDPFPVRSRRGEVPVKQVRRTSAALVGRDRGAMLPTSHQPGQALITHQSVDRARRNPMTLTPQMSDHLPTPVHALRGVHRGPQRIGQIRIGECAI